MYPTVRYLFALRDGGWNHPYPELRAQTLPSPQLYLAILQLVLVEINISEISVELDDHAIPSFTLIATVSPAPEFRETGEFIEETLARICGEIGEGVEVVRLGGSV